MPEFQNIEIDDDEAELAFHVTLAILAAGISGLGEFEHNFPEGNKSAPIKVMAAATAIMARKISQDSMTNEDICNGILEEVKSFFENMPKDFVDLAWDNSCALIGAEIEFETEP